MQELWGYRGYHQGSKDLGGQAKMHARVIVLARSPQEDIKLEE